LKADLVDQLFNSSEKRLARALLLLANFGKEGKPEPVIAKISQETLAEMIGTTRSRVSSFMNKFRQLGFIDYNGKLNSKLNHGRIGEFEPREGPLDQPAAEQYDAAYRQARAEAGIQSRWSSRSRVAPGPVPVSLSSQSAICRIVAPLTRLAARASLPSLDRGEAELTRNAPG
jgi:hypothetical protein